ncbi:MAG: methylenetetrahydrofolate--tRNA-(uracil(54)-C(5))-methyltransferase (FADH(2)-oxidizing) TrmFO [Myxococcales bacterium]|nr:methylenetetrahydrofolate--tRNA-(uracil(54)-C(5))-methyltransferase (FADH(2)-oxidizing) TrmFO [Myxococcales bacterium]
MADVRVLVVGGGLAGSECAWQLAERGVAVELVEQKPLTRTPAQQSDGLAELVCSNSFRGDALANAVGLLKEELRRAGSLVMAAGERCRVPAGGAFAVDREAFSAEVTARIDAHPRIVRRAEVVEAVPTPEPGRPVVLATGPLTGDALAMDLARLVGAEHLAYYDAIAPVVTAESIDWSVAFRASRYDKGSDRGEDGAYVNCPLDKDTYEAFVRAVVDAEKVEPREFEQPRYFEGCLPIEVMAARGERTLAFGCMKPVGLVDPRTGRRPYAVVQLRQEDQAGTAYNLVGFQTRMTWPEQRRIFRMIPGLGQAEFERLGTVHRNTFVDSPHALAPDLSLRAAPGVYLAGQVAGVEGYVESAACGLLVGLALAREACGEPPAPPPETTAFGALLTHLRRPSDDFQPSNIVWSLFPPLAQSGGRRLGKRERRAQMADRALHDLDDWLDRVGVRSAPAPAPAPAVTQAATAVSPR